MCSFASVVRGKGVPPMVEIADPDADDDVDDGDGDGRGDGNGGDTSPYRVRIACEKLLSPDKRTTVAASRARTRCERRPRPPRRRRLDLTTRAALEPGLRARCDRTASSLA